MVVIAYDYNSKVIGIVNADNEKLANAFWQGKSLAVHSTKVLERDFTKLEEHPTGVFPILETVTVDGYSLKDNRKVLIVK